MEQVNEIVNKDAKHLLIDYYKSQNKDGRRILLATISLECGVSINTVVRWIYDENYKIQKLYGERIIIELNKIGI